MKAHSKIKSLIHFSRGNELAWQTHLDVDVEWNLYCIYADIGTGWRRLGVDYFEAT